MTTYLSIDPGETTGYVKVRVSTYPAPTTTTITKPGQRTILDLHFSASGTWRGMPALEALWVDGKLAQGVDRIILEDYRVYSHKARSHVGSPVYTLREIGRIEWLAFSAAIPIAYQMAHQAKQQWPVKRVYRHFTQTRRFNKHARDALRHLLTYLENNRVISFFQPEEVT